MKKELLSEKKSEIGDLNIFSILYKMAKDKKDHSEENSKDVADTI